MDARPNCRGCGKPLLPEDPNRRMADSCPCNSPRGINHGLVRKELCTCAECDPEQTGSARPFDDRLVEMAKETLKHQKLVVEIPDLVAEIAEDPEKIARNAARLAKKREE